MILQKIPSTNFDPSNKEHREAVGAFLKRTAWGDSKFRFTHDPAYDSVSDQVKSKLLAWYLKNDKAPKKVAKKVTIKKVAKSKAKPAGDINLAFDMMGISGTMKALREHSTNE